MSPASALELKLNCAPFRARVLCAFLHFPAIQLLRYLLHISHVAMTKFDHDLRIPGRELSGKLFGETAIGFGIPSENVEKVKKLKFG
jgi:hypothetical protein